jgi:hypothetical protein
MVQPRSRAGKHDAAQPRPLRDALIMTPARRGHPRPFRTVRQRERPEAAFLAPSLGQSPGRGSLGRRGVACGFANGDRWILRTKGERPPRVGLWRIVAAPPSWARLTARPETELPDDSCTAHRPARVDGHLAPL